MNIQISPKKDDESDKKKEIRNKRQPDPIFLVITRTLICIAVIDLTIWGYFAFVKKVSLAEGLSGWITGFQKLAGYDPRTEQRIINKTIIVKKENQHQVEKQSRSVTVQKGKSSPLKYQNTDDEIHDIEVKNQVIGHGNSVMYSWRDEKGVINYSNTGFPEGNIEKLWVRRMLGE